MLCCFDLFFSRIKSLFYYQFESNASDGLQFYAWLILDGGANLLDEHIEASGGKVVLVLYAPESAQYGFTAHHVVLVDSQQLQYLCLTGGEHLLDAVLLILEGGVVGMEDVFAKLDEMAVV